MKYFRIVLYIIAFIVTTYLCLSLFSSFAALSTYKSEEVKNIQINEADKNWVSGGTFIGGNGIAKTIFGNVSISFPLHCYRTAQSFFDFSVSLTGVYTLFFLVPLTVVALIVFKIKKFRLTFINVILMGFILSFISFGIMQVWLNKNTEVGKNNLLKILPPICF